MQVTIAGKKYVMEIAMVMDNALKDNVCALNPFLVKTVRNQVA